MSHVCPGRSTVGCEDAHGCQGSDVGREPVRNSVKILSILTGGWYCLGDGWPVLTLVVEAFGEPLEDRVRDVFAGAMAR
jgi:hypothetical protein